MNDKFCISKKFLQGFLAGIVVLSFFYFFGKIFFSYSPLTKASGIQCNPNKLTYSCSDAKTVDYYIGYENNIKKFYKENRCYQEIIEGLGNYCKNSSNIFQCQITYCQSPNGNKPLYTKDKKYYLNSSCLGSLKFIQSGIEKYVDNSTIESQYCLKKSSEIFPLEYDCPTGPDVKFYYKNGKFYKDINQTIEVTDWGVGNFCKSQQPTLTKTPTLKLSTKPENSYLYPESMRIIDNTHPITEKQIFDEVSPNLVLVSKTNKIIRVVNPEKVMLQSILISDLEQMITNAIKDKVGIFVRSGFRSFEEQAIAYSQASDKTTVVKPGYSQHHSGIAIDFTTPEIGNIVNNNVHFENTQAGIWLQKNAYKYGFAQTYTKNHQGIANESWHYFYLGKKLASEWFSCFSSSNPCDVFDIQYKYIK